MALCNIRRFPNFCPDGRQGTLEVDGVQFCYFMKTADCAGNLVASTLRNVHFWAWEGAKGGVVCYHSHLRGRASVKSSFSIMTQ